MAQIVRIFASADTRFTHFKTGSYGNLGDLTAVAYSDGTPGPSYGFDRRGRRTQCVLNGMTTTLTLHDNGTLLTESYAGGTLAGLSVNNSLDSLLRRSQVQPKNGANVLATTTFGYDNASRLSSVGDGTYQGQCASSSNRLRSKG